MKKNRRAALRDIALLLAATFIPAQNSNAAQADWKKILRKIETYQGKIDIEAADNKIFIFLDADQFTEPATHEKDIMIFLQMESAPQPWPEMTLSNAIISMTADRALIVSHEDKIAVDLYLAHTKSITTEKHFPEYTHLIYAGEGFGRSIQPVSRKNLLKTNRPDASSQNECFSGGPGASSCGCGGITSYCAISCSPGFYACCNESRCRCIKQAT